jgi:hypothetical protein
MANDTISADMVSGSEFPFLVVKYNVNGVPHTVVNEEHSIVGSLPEKEFAEEIVKAVGV